MLLLEIALPIIAVVTIVAVVITNRSSGKMLGPKAFEKQEAQMQVLEKMRVIAEKLQSDPDSPDAPALQKQLTTIRAEYMRDANSALAETKTALGKIMIVKFIMAGIAAVFALVAMGWLVVTQPGPISIGSGIFLLVMLGFSVPQIIRWRRGWKFATRDRSGSTTDGNTGKQ